MISLIVDGNNICCACYFVSNPEDINWNTGWVMNKFDSMIKRISRELNVDQVYIAWDNQGTQWRKEILPEYKANRSKEGKEQLYASIEECQELNYKHFSIQGFEADDVIYSLCKAIEGYKIIASADRDFEQLLQSGVADKLYNPIAKKFREAPIHSVIEEKAIVGDKADGIKGLTGIGIKKFLKMNGSYINMSDENRRVFENNVKIIDLSKNPMCEELLSIIKNLV